MHLGAVFRHSHGNSIPHSSLHTTLSTPPPQSFQWWIACLCLGLLLPSTCSQARDSLLWHLDTTNSQGPHYRQFLVSRGTDQDKSDSGLQGSPSLQLVPAGVPVPATPSQSQSQILLGQGVEQARQGVVLARQNTFNAREGVVLARKNVLQARQGLARDKQGSYGGQAGRLQVELHPEEQLG